MMGEPDLTNRDPNGINEHLKVSFEDIFAEPDGAHSIDCVWKLSYKCFTGALNLCYMILTLFCAVPYAFCWGCEFACVTFSHVWMVTPSFRLFSINCTAHQRFMAMCLGGCLGPLMETCGLCFSKIAIEKKGG